MSLLHTLRENARTPFARYGREHSIPPSTVFRRYDELAQYINRHTVLIDWECAGLLLRRFIANDTAAVRASLEHPAVNELLTTHRGQLLVEAAFPTLRAAHDFEEQLREHDAALIPLTVIKELWREVFRPASPPTVQSTSR